MIGLYANKNIPVPMRAFAATLRRKVGCRGYFLFTDHCFGSAFLFRLFSFGAGRIIGNGERAFLFASKQGFELIINRLELQFPISCFPDEIGERSGISGKQSAFFKNPVTV